MSARRGELTEEELINFKSDEERLQYLANRKAYGNYIAYMLLVNGRSIDNKKEVTACLKTNG